MSDVTGQMKMWMGSPWARIPMGIHPERRKFRTPAATSLSTCTTIRWRIICCGACLLLSGAVSSAPSSVPPALFAGTPLQGPGAGSGADAAQANRLAASAREQLERGEPEAVMGTQERLRRVAPPELVQGLLTGIADVVSDAGWKAVRERRFDTALPLLRLAVGLAPGDPVAADRLRRGESYAQAWSQVETKVRELHALLANHRVPSAREALAGIERLQDEMPGGMDNRLSREAIRAYDRALARYNAFMREKTGIHARSLRERNWLEMRDNATDARRRELFPLDAAQVDTWLDQARRGLEEQVRAGSSGPGGRPAGQGQGRRSGDGCAAITGFWQWVAGRRLVVRDDATFEVFSDGRRIDSGRWRCLGDGRRRYLFTHRSDGRVDRVTLSPDRDRLTGVDDAGFELQGRRGEVTRR